MISHTSRTDRDPGGPLCCISGRSAPYFETDFGPAYRIFNGEGDFYKVLLAAQYVNDRRGSTSILRPLCITLGSEPQRREDLQQVLS
jgi:hypothetical protein